MKLTFTVYSMYMVILWVVAPYNTNEYCNGHTGSIMSLGNVAVVSSSRKNLNARNLTNSE